MRCIEFQWFFGEGRSTYTTEMDHFESTHRIGEQIVKQKEIYCQRKRGSYRWPRGCDHSELKNPSSDPINCKQICNQTRDQSKPGSCGLNIPAQGEGAKFLGGQKFLCSPVEGYFTNSGNKWHFTKKSALRAQTGILWTSIVHLRSIVPFYSCSKRGHMM